MNKFARRVTLLAALTLMPTVPVFSALAQAAPPQTVAERNAENRARTLLSEFYAVKLNTIWAAFTPQVKQQWGNLEGFTQYRQTGVEQFGAEQELVAERTFVQGGVTYYVRSATFEKAPQLVWAVAFGFDQLGRISSFGITLEHDRSQDQVGDVAP